MTLARITSLTTFTAEIPDSFQVEFSMDADNCHLKWIEFFHDDSHVDRTILELRARERNARIQGIINPATRYKISKIRNGLEIETIGARKDLMRGLFAEVLLQARLVLTPREIAKIVDHTEVDQYIE